MRGPETQSTVPLIDVTVNFNPTTSPAVSLDPVNVEAPQELVVLRYRLEGDASFASAPIQWVQSDSSIGLPPLFMSVQRLDSQTVLITSDNRSPSGQAVQHRYMVIVFSNGQIYATDPTIINLPPITGP